MSQRMFDVVVIGAGPAGLEAAAVVAEAGFACVVVDKMGPGGELMNLGALIGVPDLESGATGPDLLGTMVDRAMSAGAEIAIDEISEVTCDHALLAVGGDGSYSGKAVVVATGFTPGTTELADEARYEGMGLSHCAHCDAPLYAGKPVAVAGCDAWAVEEAIELAGHASKVTLIAEAALAASVDRLGVLRGAGNITVVDGRIVDLEGSDGLEAVRVRGSAGEQRIAARGLFLQVGRKPALDMLPPESDRAEGVFLAGDARQGAARTITEAIADGARAGHNAVAWVRARAGV
jgi:thioredoxin reductase (NADPH)